MALALAAAGALLVLLLQRSLIAGAGDAAEARAADAAVALARDDEVDDDGDGEDGGTTSALLQSSDGSLVQVLAGGRVVDASPGAPRDVPMTDLRAGPGQVRTSRGALPRRAGAGGPDTEDVVLVARGVRDGAGRDLVVVVARPLGPVEDSVEALRTLLLVGVPLLVLLVGGVTFVAAGRALRPVEAIRRRAERIGPAALEQRVPVPAARDEVGRLARTMNSMLERLQAAATAQRRFVSDASHELRSPLATVRTSLEVAQAHPAGTDWSALTTVLLEETARVQALVEDLLLLARADERGLQLRPCEVDLDDLVAKEADRLRRAGVQVVLDVHPVRVDADPARLSRVLRNLGDNAARHRRTRVELRLVRDGDRALLEVADDGPGIPAAERERVFERFVRLDDSRTRHAGGTGLGLPIVRQLVQAHGGTVEILDRGGVGTTVRLALPVRA